MHNQYGVLLAQSASCLAQSQFESESGEQFDPRTFYVAITRACKAKPFLMCCDNCKDIIVIFKSVKKSQNLLKLPIISLEENGTKLGIFDPASPMLFVQIKNIPYMFSDSAIQLST